jgi:hypothetical protein
VVEGPLVRQRRSQWLSLSGAAPVRLLGVLVVYWRDCVVVLLPIDYLSPRLGSLLLVRGVSLYHPDYIIICINLFFILIKKCASHDIQLVHF